MVSLAIQRDECAAVDGCRIEKATDLGGPAAIQIEALGVILMDDRHELAKSREAALRVCRAARSTAPE